MGFQGILHAVDTPSGAPMRVNTGGVSHALEETIHQKVKHLEQHSDQPAKLLLRKPRGYPAPCCSHESGKSSTTP